MHLSKTLKFVSSSSKSHLDPTKPLSLIECKLCGDESSWVRVYPNRIMSMQIVGSLSFLLSHYLLILCFMPIRFVMLYSFIILCQRPLRWVLFQIQDLQRRNKVKIQLKYGRRCGEEVELKFSGAQYKPCISSLSYTQGRTNGIQ